MGNTIVKYLGCTIHDLGDCYVVTNASGLTIGQGRTMYDAEAIVEGYVKKHG